MIGQAFGSEAEQQQQDTVIIARDGRLSSPELAQRLAKGLRATGRHVIDIGLVPSPVLYFATHHLKTGTGIMITGSHNPPDYNGLKMMLSGNTLHSDDIQALLKRIQDDNLTRQDRGDFKTIDLTPTYIARIAADIRIERPIHFAYDCGNGAAGEIAPRLFQALGCEAKGLFTDIDGTFPHHHPDPSKASNLLDLIQHVQQEHLDLGIAFDGDADRLGVVDKQGCIIWADRLMVLFATALLKQQPGNAIVFDVKCSQQLSRAIEQASGVPVMSKTGHSYIKQSMLQHGAIFGGEMGGHFSFNDPRWYGFDDGLYAAARLLELLSQSPLSATEIFSALPNSLATPEINIALAEGEPFIFMQQFIQLADFEKAEIITLDGLRVHFDKGWGLIRASNTTPALVLRFEADDELAMREIQALFLAQIQRVNPRLRF